MTSKNEKRVLGEGRFLRLMDENTWEYVERRKVADVVVIVAVTPGEELLLVEQYRPALHTNTIELPAGLVGDIPGEEEEVLETAARRELLEETGYEAEALDVVLVTPTSSGLTSETATLLMAGPLRRVDDGGGDDSEDITVHRVPLAGIDAWLDAQAARGALIDSKIHTGLYFLATNRRGRS